MQITLSMSTFSIKTQNRKRGGNDENLHSHRKKEQLTIFETLRREEKKCMLFTGIPVVAQS